MHKVKLFGSIYFFILILGFIFIGSTLTLMAEGKISGKIYYGGSQLGPIRIAAVCIPPTTDELYSYVAIPAAGEYEIELSRDGLYLIGAFMDVDVNMLPGDQEPAGFYLAPIYISGGNEVTNIDFALRQLPRGTGAIEGKVIYDSDPGALSENIQIMALGLSLTPFTATSINVNETENFKLPGLMQGDYLIAAFIDEDGDGVPDFDEPIGMCKEMLSVEDKPLVIDDILIDDRSNYSGSIQGVLNYDGSKEGAHQILCMGQSNTPISNIDVGDDGNFTINNLDEGEYYLLGYLDLNKNSFIDPGEPYSESYLNGIQLEDGASITGLDLLLQDYGTGSVSGVITYDGAQRGIIATLVVGISPTPINLAVNFSPGLYSVNGLAAGLYTVCSFMDLNGNLLPDTPEPIGLYTDSLLMLNTGDQKTDIDLVLDDTKAAAISGNIIVPETMSGTVYVAAIGLSATPLKAKRYPEPGAYTISNLGAGKYVIAAFLDINHNGSFDNDELFGTTDILLNVEKDMVLSDIDLVLAQDVYLIASGVASEKADYLNQQFRLLPNFPNPFNPSTVISYKIPQSSQVRVKIYNLLGQEIITLVEKYQLAGTYEIKWNGQDQFARQVPAGVYIYCLEAGEYTDFQKMTLVY